MKENFNTTLSGTPTTTLSGTPTTTNTRPPLSCCICRTFTFVMIILISLISIFNLLQRPDEDWRGRGSVLILYVILSAVMCWRVYVRAQECKDDSPNTSCKDSGHNWEIYLHLSIAMVGLIFTHLVLISRLIEKTDKLELSFVWWVLVIVSGVWGVCLLRPTLQLQPQP